MRKICLTMAVLFDAVACSAPAGDLELNDLEYFERQGVNVLVFSNPFTGGFNDEKDSGIEVIHMASGPSRAVPSAWAPRRNSGTSFPR